SGTFMAVDWMRIHQQERLRPATLPLALLSLLYGLGVRLRVRARLKGRRHVLPGFTVSIGNLTVGGTGKTPAVRMLAEWAAQRGYRVAVLSRGYGGRHGQKVLVVSDGSRIYAGAEEAGDEPCLLAQRLREVPVVVSRSRYEAGRLAHRRFGSTFFILDDGFQHLTLRRDLDIVLLDALRPFGNGHLLPLGPLREPVGHLDRADAFVITRSADKDSVANLADTLGETCPGKPVYRGVHVPDEAVFPRMEGPCGVDFLKGLRVVAFAGIARPDAFLDTLEHLGTEVASFRGFRDHYRYTGADIRDLVTEKKALGARFLLTTEKDWVRMGGPARQVPELGYLAIRFDLSSGRNAFFEMVRERAERALAQGPAPNDRKGSDGGRGEDRKSGTVE
ncbi:MAG: tetraacyldisaccharide 4'-kinase, partial [Deltaproteobacteria bacterium]|nr:tetraacyldisaccharide 4'-kinase [Deltaproteobacteria bacterium]